MPLKFAGNAEIRRAGRSLLAQALCIGCLTGCDSLADLGSDFRHGFEEALQVIEDSAKTDSERGAKAANKKPVIVRLGRSDVRRLQARLTRLGYRPGPADGILGTRTVKAMNSYQQAFGLSVTDGISSEFLDHLEAASAPKTAGGDASRRSPALAAGGPPMHLPGTAFIYSNGDAERVLGPKDKVVQWAMGDGNNYSAHRNFLLPKIYWTLEEERGTSTISGDPERLWPAREGDEVSFSSKITLQRDDDPDVIRRRTDQWRCRNKGVRNITVQAGSFNTHVLTCTREANAEAEAVERTWYYAPEIGHYVRFVESHPEGDQTDAVDLVAMRPGAPGWPPIVRAALARVLVHALEMDGSSARLPWNSSGVDAQVTIEVKSRFVAGDGRQCRRFVQIWSENGRSRHYPAVACKNGSGKWAIPTLEGDTAASLATADGLS